MKRFLRKEVFIPGFLPVDGKPEKLIPIRARITLNPENGKFVFDAKNDADSGPKSPNYALTYEEAYAAIAAFAISMGKLNAFPKKKDAGHLIGKKGAKVEFLALDLKDLKTNLFHFLGEKEELWWPRIQKAEVKKTEDLVILDEDEIEALLVAAKEVTKSAKNVSEEEISKFFFTKEDTFFAPNTEWGFWALANALCSDPKWQRMTYEMDGERLRVAWQNLEVVTAKKTAPGADFFYGKRRFGDYIS